ncbi:MAG TPA: hypothetical protein VK536_06265 [Candidatus Limnocylindrales bacterium]|nr:hypothetical protein [Candidatus Limnocylindrales bacterium]
MPIQIFFNRYSPENDPLFNESARKVGMAYINKRGALLEKHGIKELGSWIVPIEHLTISVLEAQSLDAFQKLMMEPEYMALLAYVTEETKVGISAEDAMKMLK